jgi:tetratricopeptide (TPR) repeat protein
MLRRLLEAGGRNAAVVCAIDGMGGVGKSALALQIAHQLVEAGAFPDGQLYVNLQGATAGLAPLEPSDVLGRMLRSLGLESAAIPGDVGEAAARFRSLTAGRRLLVLLDNARSDEQVRPLLPGSPTCTVLVTSRQVLATLEGVHGLHLDVPVLEHALWLLSRLAGESRVVAEPEAAADVVRSCGRLPLAIRIAGARLVARASWPIGELAARLADATHRLEELRVGELAVRGSFDVSVHALRESPDATDRAAAPRFALLSLLDGPDFGIAPAAMLLDQTEATTRTMLERLVDAQLLETPRPGRYQFHDLVRLYARDHASHWVPESEQVAALTRVFSFYTATAWHTHTLLLSPSIQVTADARWTTGGLEFAEASSALIWLELERVNLLAVITQASQWVSRGVPAALPGQLTRALFGFFEGRGHGRDWVQACSTALEVAQRFSNRDAQASAQSDLGHACARLGRYAEAIDAQRECLTILQELGDHRAQATCLRNLSLNHMWLGQYAEAIALLEASLVISRQLADGFGQAVTQINLSIVYKRLGRHAEAIELLEPALMLFREQGDRMGVAHCLHELGVLYGRLERYGEASAALQESVMICRVFGQRVGEASGLHELGIVHDRLGQAEDALVCLQQARDIFRELGDRRGQAAALRDLGDALSAAGRAEHARTAWRDGLAIAAGLQIPEVDDLCARLAPTDESRP